MQIKKLAIVLIILLLLISPVLAINSSSESTIVPEWDSQWKYKNELKLPISTENPSSHYQPIDIKLEFENPCWAKDENKHSIRVICWEGKSNHELESQIYDLEFIDTNFIKRCGLVFLIPPFANGNEKYFVYYDDLEKTGPNYKDHVNVEDSYYYFEPISGVSIEGDYYKITQEGSCVYAVGQKGHILKRSFSQVVVKQNPGSEAFDISKSDMIGSFCFSYNVGSKDEDENSSGFSLLSKKIIVDGNLMVEFGIVSESIGKELRSTNVYKYYYCPTDEKRICVNVKHEVLDDCRVKGAVNVDGRYGSLMSFSSKSAKLQQLRFGEIFPLLHFYEENDVVKEYYMNSDPESKKREWIISYEDDCDLGKEAWISYDNGEEGRAHGLIFSSNQNIVKNGTKETDGMQIKVEEKEYLDLIGAEIDYAIVSYGRNSFERGKSHDLEIPDDLVVEYDVEFYTSEEGGYEKIIDESKYYRDLVKHRHSTAEEGFEGEKNIYTLTVISPFAGRISSISWLQNITKDLLPEILVELYQDKEKVSQGFLRKPVIGSPKIKFPKLSPGNYTVKLYRIYRNGIKKYIGIDSIELKKDTSMYVSCTWQKNVDITIHDQNGRSIKDVELLILKGDTVVAENTTKEKSQIKIGLPFNLLNSYAIEESEQIKFRNFVNFSNPYLIKSFYKGFLVYEEELKRLEENVDICIDLYDLKVESKDKLGLTPGLNVKPILISSQMHDKIELKPEESFNGVFIFRNLPKAEYQLIMSYGEYVDKKVINIPNHRDSERIIFSATYDVKIDLFDSRGIRIQDGKYKIDVSRNGKCVYESINSDDKITIPPGKYTIKVVSEDNLIGSKLIELKNDKNIRIVTNEKSIIPILVTGLVFIIFIQLIVLFVFKKVSLNSLLKILAMCFVLLSLVQPWWILDAVSSDSFAEKNSDLYIVPQALIEETTYGGENELELATIPEIFTNFLEILLLIVFSGFILIGVSFVPNIILKRRFYMGLISASILFLILVAAAFFFGMSKISEISVGTIQGEGTLEVILPNGAVSYMAANWGLGNGFYLCIIAALITLGAGLLDLFKRKELIHLELLKFR